MTQQQAILDGFVIGVPTVLISGFATPVENMPILLQRLAQAIPLTHFLIIIEGCFLKALPPRDVLDHLRALAIIAPVALPMAMFFCPQPAAVKVSSNLLQPVNRPFAIRPGGTDITREE